MLMRTSDTLVLRGVDCRVTDCISWPFFLWKCWGTEFWGKNAFLNVVSIGCNEYCSHQKRNLVRRLSNEYCSHHKRNLVRRLSDEYSSHHKMNLVRRLFNEYCSHLKKKLWWEEYLMNAAATIRGLWREDYKFIRVRSSQLIFSFFLW